MVADHAPDHEHHSTDREISHHILTLEHHTQAPEMLLGTTQEVTLDPTTRPEVSTDEAPGETQ